MEKKSLFVFFVALLSSLIMFYFISLLNVFLNLDGNKEINYLLIVGMQIFVFILPVIVVSRFLMINPLKLINFNFNLNWKIFLISILGLLILDVLNTCIVVIQENLTPIFLKQILINSRESTADFYRLLMLKGSWLDLYLPITVGALLPAITEETYFRGLLQGSLKEYSKFTSIFIPSILFGIFHFQVAFLLPLIIIGVYFAIITNITGSIFPAILLHLLNNLKSIIMINVLGTDTFEYDFITSVILFVISILIIIYLLKRISNLQTKISLQAAT